MQNYTNIYNIGGISYDITSTFDINDIDIETYSTRYVSNVTGVFDLFTSNTFDYQRCLCLLQIINDSINSDMGYITICSEGIIMSKIHSSSFLSASEYMIQI